MNKVVLIGRLTKEPELRYTSDNKAYVRFTLAINRNYKKDDGTTDADFINCFAWEKRAETISKYVKKGNKLGVHGEIRTSSYEKEDGSKNYLTEVMVQEIEFLESKPKEELPEPLQDSYNTNQEVFNNVMKETDPFASFGTEIELSDDDLPF